MAAGSSEVSAELAALLASSSDDDDDDSDSDEEGAEEEGEGQGGPGAGNGIDFDMTEEGDPNSRGTKGRDMCVVHPSLTLSCLSCSVCLLLALKVSLSQAQGQIEAPGGSQDTCPASVFCNAQETVSTALEIHCMRRGANVVDGGDQRPAVFPSAAL